MPRHDRSVRAVVLPAGEDCRPHRVGAPRDDGVRARGQDGQVLPRAAASGEEEVPPTEAAQVPPAPLHVVGDVEEEDVVELLPKVVNGVVKVAPV